MSGSPMCPLVFPRQAIDEVPRVLLHDSRLPGASTSIGPRLDPTTRVLEEFASAWARGDRPRAESFLSQHPLIADQPEAAIRLIYEEVCHRQAEGEVVTLNELAGRFPRWRDELAVLLDCDRLLGAMPAAPVFPESGEPLGDFLLLAELGRGARGRCFLAAQPSLSNRQVVVKVASDDHAEHLSMARLQHTHIMPLYSDHVFPERRLRALCMPYLGGATLARILDELATAPPVQRSGRSLLESIDRESHGNPWPQAVDSPARRFLSQASFDRVACWMGACLADALQYAHDRGLVHMDVKPSNILLTADGQPMLLDFHLARGPITLNDPPDEGIGGTPGYMSPEQERAVAAMQSGRPAPIGVDARTDIYSMGLVLAELLGARAGADPPRQADYPGGVSTGLADVIARCLAPDPETRYREASALADDLRRHMADLPLKGVANRNLSERWTKWWRRRPMAFSGARAAMIAVALATVAAVGAWVGFVGPRLRGAAQSLAEGRMLLDRGDLATATRALTRGAALIEGLPGSEQIGRELAEAQRRADRLARVDRLHQLVDRLRIAESAAGRPAAGAQEVARRWRAVWSSRGLFLGRTDDARLDRQIRDDLLDLAIIGSMLEVQLQPNSKRAAHAHRAGLAVLDEAEASLGPSHVLYLARQAHARSIGLPALAEAAARDADRVPPRTAWEHDAAGRVLLSAGDLVRAGDCFERAMELRPQDFWPNFHQGICAYRRGRYREAVSAFRVAIALAPDRSEGYYNRALALIAIGRDAEATRDLAHARALDPSLTDPSILPKPLSHRASRGR